MDNTTLKRCPRCNEMKPLNAYSYNRTLSDGLDCWCKSCRYECGYNQRNTFKGFMKTLLKTAYHSAKDRKEKGRIEAGIYDMTFDDILLLWESQQGLCHYSNLPMITQVNRNWKCSLERLDPDKGYIRGNVVLCCSEFNNACQWSQAKVSEIHYVLTQTHTYKPIGFTREDPKTRAVITKNVIDGVDHYNCNVCGEIKPRSDFSPHITDGCRECQKSRRKRYYDSPRGMITQLAGGSRLRSRKKRMECDIDFDFLVELFHLQQGRCAYSNLPMSFASHKRGDWKVSVERIDSLKGYTKDNVCLICYEFNSTDNSVRDKHNTSESSAWSKEKFDTFYVSIVKQFICS